MSQSNKKSKLLTEEEIFAEILHSMGIEQHEYEPQVLLALRYYKNYNFVMKKLLLLLLSEYGRRITSELLCDAKDYSSHAQKSDIDNDDIDLAIKLTMHRRSGIVANSENMNKLARALNGQDLSELIDKDRVLIKYPRKLTESLLQRSYTYIPGNQGYEEFATRNNDNSTLMDVDNSNNNSNQNNNQNNKCFKPIVLNPKASERTVSVNSVKGFDDTS